MAINVYSNDDSKSHARKWSAKALSLGMLVTGVANTMMAKAMHLDVSPAVNLYSAIGGATLYGALKFSESDTMEKLDKIKNKGIDTYVTPNEYLEFSKTLCHNLSWQKAYSSLVNVRDVFFKDLHPDFHSNETFDANAVNVIHLCAKLGVDDSEFAKKMMKDPVFRNEHVKHLFTNSRDLLSLLRPNEKNLLQFTESVRKSLGDDAPFFLKSVNDAAGSQQEWLALVEKTRMDVAEKMQEFNFHYHLSVTMASAAVKSTKSNFTQDDAEALFLELDRYRELEGKYPLGSPIEQTVSFAKSLKTDVAALCLRKQPERLLDLKKISKHFKDGQAFYYHPSHEFKINRVASTLYKDMTPWADAHIPLNVQQLFVDTLFNNMANVAVENITSVYEQMKNKPAHEQEMILSELGIPSEDVLNAPAPEDVAQQKIMGVQQTLAQAMVNEHVYERDMSNVNKMF